MWPSSVKLATPTRSSWTGHSASRVRPGTASRPACRRAESARSRSAIAVHADLLERLAGGGERDRADHVRRARLEAVGRVGPDHVVERDELDRAAAVQQRVAVQRRAADERAGAERRVELVAGEREVVDAGVGHRDRAVRGELGGVDEQLRAVLVGERGELRERPDLAGDVGGAGDGEQVDARRGAARGAVTSSSSSAEVVNGQHAQVVPAPGEHVRVVLDRRGEHPRRRPGARWRGR